MTRRISSSNLTNLYFLLFYFTDKYIMVIVRNDSAVALKWRLFTPGCFRQALHRLFDDFREKEESLH